MRQRTTKFIFVTGGVLSSLGKGLASASLGDEKSDAMLRAEYLFLSDKTYALRSDPT